MRQKMKIAILDTETTGLLRPDPTPLKNQPYITEIYCCVIDDSFNLLGELDSMVKPPIPLPEETIKITGITDEMIEDAPRFASIYPEFAKLLTGCDLLVAHNLPFDRGMIANELKRIDKLTNFPWPRHHLCTVEASMHLKGYRLNLTKLHYLATQKGFSAHRAKDDVHALVRSFYWLVEEGHIDLEKYEI